MKVEIKDNTLFIEVEMQTPTLSSTGKSLLIANTGGNVATEAQMDGEPVYIWLTASIKPPKEVAEAARAALPGFRKPNALGVLVLPATAPSSANKTVGTK